MWCGQKTCERYLYFLISLASSVAYVYKKPPVQRSTNLKTFEERDVFLKVKDEKQSTKRYFWDKILFKFFENMQEKNKY